jgi:peptidyl-dipeptidase Dcp
MSLTLQITADNPFAQASSLPYNAPRFDLVRDEHYHPAIEEGMRQQLAEVEAIASSAEPATFENTIVAMEASGRLLARVWRVFSGVVDAYTNDTLQKLKTVVAPKLANHHDAILLNAALFRRVESIYDQRRSLSLTPEQEFLVERYYRDFIRAGAQLSAEDKHKMRALNTEEANLVASFQTKLLAATNAGAIVVDDVADLEGLSDADLAAAAEAATERGLPGKHVIALHNTTQHPLYTSLKNRRLRERLWIASTTRAERGDENDTRAIIVRLAELRAEKASLLGFASYAAYNLDDEGAKTPENAIDLLSKLAAPALAKARDEAADIQRMINDRDGGFALAPWDWQHYAEQVRKQKYDVDEAEIKPYLELNSVVENGVFFAATRLFGITFVQRDDIPVYAPDVRVFEVLDQDGAGLALLYVDYFKRENKVGGAWMDTFVDQSALTGMKAVVYNAANFTKPAPGDSALISFDDVTTLFHEFGHALHGMFSRVTYPTFSGSNTPRDFVEFPSQFNEHWALEPSVFANYAKHHETGAPMPQSLVEKIKRARTFNQGFATTEYLGAALLDLSWHTVVAGTALPPVDRFERLALEKYAVAMADVPPRYRSSYFAHAWSGGYGSSYYAYLWAEVLDHDAFAWFEERGGMTPENGEWFRDRILSRGGTQEAASLYREFTGRDPRIEPLMRARGLVSSN